MKVKTQDLRVPLRGDLEGIAEGGEIRKGAG
jgi:hypothetical protein